MSPVDVPRLILLGLSALLVALTLRGLATGEMKRAGLAHHRDEAPRDFWFEIATSLAVALPVAFLVLLLPRRRDGHEVNVFVYLLPLFLAQALVQALWYGRTPFFTRDVSRRENPAAFRAVMMLEVAVLLGSLALAAWLRPGT